VLIFECGIGLPNKFFERNTFSIGDEVEVKAMRMVSDFNPDENHGVFQFSLAS
jgi:hypothetical protein